MPRDFRMAFCTVALLEASALLVMSLLVLRAYAKKENLRHVAGMAWVMFALIAGIVLRMWEGHMDDDPWLVLWFLAHFGLGIYFVSWFYVRRPGAPQ